MEAHDTHAVEGSESWSVEPAAHLKAELPQMPVEPAGMNEPVVDVQAKQDVDGSLSWSTVPAGHLNSTSVQPPVDCSGTKYPAVEHVWQAVLGVPSWSILPAGQAVQDAPSFSKPACSQDVRQAPEWPLGAMVPAGQAWQAVAALLSWSVVPVWDAKQIIC